MLMAASVTGCSGGGPVSDAAAPARFRYGPDNQRLQWKMVTDPREMAAADAASQLRFRVLPPLRVEGDDLVVAGELENPADTPAVVLLFGVDFQPLTLSVRWENGLAWKPPCPEPWCAPQPPVPPPPFRITLPPHSVVEFSGRCDLRTINYQGAPEARFDWRFGFAGAREAEGGTFPFRLSPR
jgi:hypothetical protein